jgi:hypothetical protein
MLHHRSAVHRRASELSKFGAGVCLSLVLASCSAVQVGENEVSKSLAETARLVEEVKTFESILGIEPTGALSRTVQERPALSMLWLWLQRAGTLAVRAPIDIRMAVGFSDVRERLAIEQVYRVEGYSVYYRQGNEFADERSVTTAGFAAEGAVRRVKIILHEDLHGERNFSLPWEMEEAIITPLGSLAAVEFFKWKEDRENLLRAQDALEEERQYARQLRALVGEAETLFKTESIAEAKNRILDLLPLYPVYHRQFQRQIVRQHAPTVLEAKLSHDLIYYKYFDQITALAEKASSLATLINDFKELARGRPRDELEEYLKHLNMRYGPPAK